MIIKLIISLTLPTEPLAWSKKIQDSITFQYTTFKKIICS